MSTARRRKKEKSVNQLGTQHNATSEILILPPDLLQKIGIDFKQLSQYQAAPRDELNLAHGIQEIQHLDQTTSGEIFSSPNISTSDGTSSMLETATLMTESLFMSPTFVLMPNDDATFQDKIPTGNEIISTELNHNSSHTSSEVVTTLYTTQPLVQVSNCDSTVLDIMPADNITIISTSEYNVENPSNRMNFAQILMSNEVCGHTNKDTSEHDEISNNELPLENVENKLLPDISAENSFNNSESLFTIDANLKIFDIDNIESVISNSIDYNSKTNLFYENIDDSMQDNIIELDNVNNNNVHNNIKKCDKTPNIISVPVAPTLNNEDIIFINANDSKVQNNGMSYVNKSDHNNILERNITDINAFEKDIIKRKSDPSLQKETKNKDYEPEPTLQDECIEVNFITCVQEDIDYVIPKQYESSYNLSGDHDYDTHSDQYTVNKNPLFAISKNMCQQLNNLTPDSYEPSKIMNNKHTFKPHNLNKHGVEEPGGNTNEKVSSENKNIKTYENCGIRKSKNNKECKKMKDSATGIKIIMDTSKIDIKSDGNIETSLKQQQFCNCQDFGCKFNTNEVSPKYTHIHFINEKPAVCKAETLFYNEEISSQNEEIELDMDESDSSDIEICWQSIISSLKDENCIEQKSNSPKESVEEKRNKMIVSNNNNSNSVPSKVSPQEKPMELPERKIINKIAHIEENVTYNKNSSRPTKSPQKVNSNNRIKKASLKEIEGRGSTRMNHNGTQKLPENTEEINEMSPNSRMNEVDKEQNDINIQTTNIKPHNVIKSPLKEENKLKKISTTMSIKVSESPLQSKTSVTEQIENISKNKKCGNASHSKIHELEVALTTAPKGNKYIIMENNESLTKKQGLKSSLQSKSSEADVIDNMSKNKKLTATTAPKVIENKNKEKGEPHFMKQGSKSPLKLKTSDTEEIEDIIKNKKLTAIIAPKVIENKNKEKVEPHFKKQGSKSFLKSKTSDMEEIENISKNKKQEKASHSKIHEVAHTAAPKVKKYINKKKDESHSKKQGSKSPLQSKTSDTVEIENLSKNKKDVDASHSKIHEVTYTAAPKVKKYINKKKDESHFKKQGSKSPLQLKASDTVEKENLSKNNIGVNVSQSVTSEHDFKDNAPTAPKVVENEGNNIELNDHLSSLDDRIFVGVDRVKQHSESTKRPNMNSRKRKHSVGSDSSDDVPLRKLKSHKNQSSNNNNPKKDDTSTIIQCGVCDKYVKDWDLHLMKEHCYVAWKNGERPVNVADPDEVKEHLYQLGKHYGGLKCHKCSIVRKYVKGYQKHMKECEPLPETETGEKVKPMLRFNSETGVVKCGRCKIDVKDADWIEHNRDKHENLAWVDGAQPVNEENRADIQRHLHDLCIQYRGLACYKCGIVRRFVRSYLIHVAQCTFDKETSLQKVEYLEDESPDESNICGACKREIKSSKWIEHIRKEHNYLGWRQGKEELDVDNEDSVFAHLEKLVAKVQTFECRACGLKRKKVETFMKHMKICYSIQSSFTSNDSIVDVNNSETVTCAQCSETVGGGKIWAAHAINEHYNLAWVVGSKPIDLKNPYEVEKHLKLYKEAKGRLVCKMCCESRVSLLGFYAHIIICKKTEEEIEALKETCDKCGTKFLGIYRQQHLRYHETQAQKEQVKDKQLHTEVPLESERSTGRRAASRALAVINRYRKETSQFNCLSCSFETDDKLLLKNHECSASDASEYSDKSEESSTDLDEDEEVDDEHDTTPARKTDILKSSLTLPFAVKNAEKYIVKSFKAICIANFSSCDLYTEWQTCHYDLLAENEYSQYMPKIKQSCQLSLHKNEWTTQALFESTLNKGLRSIYLGSYPTCLAWAPPRSYTEPTGDDEMLAIACHNVLPSEVYDKLSTGPNLIQIWNFSDFNSSEPELEMGIAHDYGVIWAMSWCPSGTRHPELDSGQGRLGLLAISCSNGYVYIMVIPSGLRHKERICRIRPVAKLSLSSGERRTVYQATSVDWSKKSGHSTIVVGYSNGVVAYYDLTMKSPLLRKQENDMIVFYPYYDELLFKGPILSLSLYMGISENGEEILGAGSLTGSLMKTRAGPMAISRQSDWIGASGGKMYTHWPSFMITCDESNSAQRLHELEIFGERRRLNASCCVDSCLHCGEMASLSLSHIRIIQPHPAHTEIKRQLKAVITMKPLKPALSGKKRKLDDLAVKVEPSTYDAAIKKYGLEIFYARSDKGLKIEDPSPDRYSLSHVRATAFCPSPQFHTRLAFVTQAGMLFVMPIAYGNDQCG